MTLILSPKIRKTKKCQNLEVLSNLTYINFRQTNAINMIFLHKLYAGNTANQII